MPQSPLQLQHGHALWFHREVVTRQGLESPSPLGHVGGPPHIGLWCRHAHRGVISPAPWRLVPMPMPTPQGWRQLNTQCKFHETKSDVSVSQLPTCTTGIAAPQR